MKKLLFVPLALLVFSLKAQNSIRVMDANTEFSLAPNATVHLVTQTVTNTKFTFDVQNTSASTQTYAAKRYDILLNTSPASQDYPAAIAYFCFAGYCYDKTVPTPTNYLVLTPNQKASEVPGQWQMLIADLDECEDIGQSIVRYTFKNVNNAIDSVQVTIDYNNAVWLGLKENAKSVSAFRLMPNPSSNGLVSIKSDNDFSKVEMINQLGSVVLNKSVSPLNGCMDLDLSAFAAGVYYVRINNGDKTSTQKLVITGH